MKEPASNITQQEIEDAIGLHQSGALGQAKEAYNTILSREPEHAEALHGLGLIASQVGAWGEAETYIRRALRSMGHVPFYHANLGHVLTQAGRFDEAVNAFRTAQMLVPSDASAMRKLAYALERTGNADEALNWHIRAFEIAPLNGKETSDLASRLKNAGRFEASAALYAYALALMPGDPIVLYNQALLFMSMRPVEEWDEVADAVLNEGSLASAQAYDLHVRRAIAFWVKGQKQACAQALIEAQTLTPVESNRNAQNMRAYSGYLEALLTLPQARPQDALSSKPIALIGDSHSLSYAGSTVMWGGNLYTLVSRLVVGTKAWHLAKEGANSYKREIEDVVNRLPSGMPCWFVIGEIDCRMDEGMLAHQARRGGDLQAIAVRTAQGYVAWLASLVKDKGRPIALLNVPAPNKALLRARLPNCDEGALNRQEKLIKYFNKALEEAAFCPVIDLYDATCRQPNLHLDAFHLHPRALGFAKGLEVPENGA